MTYFPPTEQWGRVATLALLLWLLHTPPLSAQTARWQPRPAPNSSEVFQWEALSAGDDASELAPGDTLRMIPDRLSVYALRVEPADLADKIEVDRLFETDANRRAVVPVRPLELPDGSLVIESATHRKAPLRIRLADDADRIATVDIARLERTAPRYYWIHWLDRLYAWLDAGAEGSPPAGLPVARRGDILADARQIALLRSMVQDLEPDDSTRSALAGLTRALLVRAVERVREPAFGYYNTYPVADFLDDPLPTRTVEAGSRTLGEASLVAASGAQATSPQDSSGARAASPQDETSTGAQAASPQDETSTGARAASPQDETSTGARAASPQDKNPVLEIEGPCQVHLGVRAIKKQSTPNARRSYRLTVREQDRQIHGVEFSSRASKYAAIENETVDDEFSRSAALRAHFAATAPKPPPEDAPAPENPPEEAPSQTASEQPTGKVYGRTATDGEVVGWRRQTRWWVPPGRHRYELDFQGATVLVDGEVARPKRRVEHTVTNRFDPEIQLLEVPQHIEDSDRPADLLLRAERLAYLYRWEAAAGLLRDNRQRLVEAGGPAIDVWIRWRILSWEESDQLSGATVSGSRVDTWLDNPDIPRYLVRRYAFTLARRRPERAYDLVGRFPTDGDSPRHRLQRAAATLRGGQDAWRRWAGAADLYTWWQNAPDDERLEEALQDHWWHRTYWRDLSPAGPTEPRSLLEPIFWGQDRVSLAKYADRTDIWYRVDPGQTYNLEAPTAPDHPDRLTRLRLKLAGDPSGGIRTIHVDGRRLDILRTERLQHLDLALRPGQPHRLRYWDDDDEATGPAEVFVDQPPTGSAKVAASSIVKPRDYWSVGPDDPRQWQLPADGTPRFARLSVRGGRKDQTIALRYAFGDGWSRPIEVDWSVDGPPSATPPVQLVIPVPRDASRMTLRTDQKTVSLRAEVRGGRLPSVDDDEAIDVPVELPVDQTRLDQLTRLSRAIRTREGRDEATFRIERAMLLMSIARNRLARVDLETVMDDFRPGHPHFRKARLLRRTVLDRLSSRWLDIEADFLDDRDFVPLDLPAQLGPLPKDDAACADLVAAASRAMRDRDWTGAISAIRRRFSTVDDPACTAAWRILHATAARRAGNTRSALAILGELIDQWPSTVARRWEAERRFADIAVSRIRQNPRSLPAGTGVEAYIYARHAVETFPSSPVRAAWFGSLRWTSWESVRDLGGGFGVATGTFDPDLPPENLDDFRLPVVDDPNDAAVEFALLGVDWPRDQALQMYNYGSRSLAFRVDEPGRLVVHRATVDHRPDLQPPGAGPPRRLLTRLQGPEGQTLPSRPENPPPEKGTLPTSVFQLPGSGVYELALDRPNGYPGRLFFAHPLVEGPSGSAPPQPRRRRQLLIAAPNKPGEIVLAGPTLLRVDARPVGRLPAGKLVVRVTHTESGDEQVHRLDLKATAQQGATLGPEEESVGPARRLLVPIPESGAHRITFTPKAGLATVRMRMRVDDRNLQNRRPEPAEKEEETEEEPSPIQSPGDATRSPLRTTGEADLPVDRVDLPPTEHWSTFANTGYYADDLGLSREIAGDLRDVPYFALNAGGAGSLVSPELWGWSSLGLRARPGMPLVGQFELGADLRPDWWRLRFQPEFDLYYQGVDRPYLASRTQLRVARSFGIAESLWWLNGIRGTLRTQNDAAFDRTDGRIAPRVYSFYADDHPVTTDLLSLLWWRPHLNTVAYGMLQPVFNPNFTPDKIRFRAVGRALFETTRVDLGYRYTWFFGDAGRDQPMVRHDVDLAGRLAYWIRPRHLLTVGAEARWEILKTPANLSHDISAGLTLSYWFTGPGRLKSRPPTDLSFERLLEPEYFRR